MKEQLKSIALPVLVAAYPVLFLYAHNALVLPLGSLWAPLGLSLLVAMLAYGIFFLLRRSPLAASLGAAVFMLFYFFYGTIYHKLISLDRFHIEHFVLLPLVIAVGIYVGYFITQLKPSAASVLRRVLLIVSLALVLFNLTIVVPVEAKKIQAQPKQRTPVPVTGTQTAAHPKYPDVYYIIFDEYVGFDAMRDYWHDNSVDVFQNFLEQNHFFIATQSHTPTINTLTEMASRLNLHQYAESDDTNVQLNALNNNKVMQIFKSYGYSTAVLNMAFQNINADYVQKYDAQQISGMAADQFRQTFYDDTMFSALSGVLQNGNAAEIKQRDYIFKTLNKTADMSDVQSPKFVYAHLLLPHEPFIFDANGNLIPPQYGDDWNYYHGQYQYTNKLAMQLITRLLAKADPNNPPVIIVQSDEGARNLRRKSADNIILNGYLENYPVKYYSDILNALYLPGFDTSKLPADLPPIDTFQIVLNYYLHAGVSIDNPPAK